MYSGDRTLVATHDNLITTDILAYENTAKMSRTLREIFSSDEGFGTVCQYRRITFVSKLLEWLYVLILDL